jgi:hypothetical protein
MNSRREQISFIDAKTAARRIYLPASPLLPDLRMEFFERMALVISRANQTSGAELEADAVLIAAKRVKSDSGPSAQDIPKIRNSNSSGWSDSRARCVDHSRLNPPIWFGIYRSGERCPTEFWRVMQAIF